MQDRVTGIRSAIVVLTLTVGPWAVAPALAQSAPAQTGADTCLGKPGKTTPRGSHWYYRIERPSGRRCWYLGQEKSKARQAPRAEQTAVPPAAAEQPDVPPSARASAERSAVATPAPPVAAAFSANWPPILKPTAESSAPPDAETVEARSQATADEMKTQAEEMPLVWPILTAEERATASQPSEAALGMGHLLILLAAVAVFTAIACRAILKLTSAWLRRRRRNLYSNTPITELPERIMPWQQRMVETAQEPAARWEDAEPPWRSIDLVHQRPHGANDDEYEDRGEAPARRRQAVA
ncbi:MAG: hypothetical protein ACRECO_00645 [Xanthobacteraceae bacterium]